MGVINIGKRDPSLQITLTIKRRIGEDRPPEKHVEVRRDPPNLFRRQTSVAIIRFRVPLAWSPEKKSRRTSFSTQKMNG